MNASSRVIVSTVGTSMLTNGASQEVRGLLTRTANTPEPKLSIPDRAALIARADEVRAGMESASPEAARKQSAELNGVVRLGLFSADAHFLIATDTLQGRLCSSIAAEWIRSQGVDASAHPIPGLTTADTESFRAGVNNLLRWCDSTLPPLQAQRRRVIFNLVGGFKAMQAYMQVLGMFYADEIVYIFESGSELIRIPRLPVQWDHESLRKHAAVVVRLYHGAQDITPEMTAGIPEAYLEEVEIEGRRIVALSTWGEAAWLQHRLDILSGDLLQFPNTTYETRFVRDYRGLNEKEVRASLQDAVAKAAVLLANGGPEQLRRDGSLQYTALKGVPNVDHFRATLALRITCSLEGAKLTLRRCGGHHINDNP